MAEPTFTPEQIAHWHAYEAVRKDGKYPMVDSRARALTGMGTEEYDFTFFNYAALKAAALKL